MAFRGKPFFASDVLLASVGGALRGALFLLALVAVAPALGAEDIVTLEIRPGDYRAAREALIDAVETEGLALGTILPYREMLARTARKGSGPYLDAEIVQFCSGTLAHAMVDEAPAQMALCPLGIAVYVAKQAPDTVVFAYRVPAPSSPARRSAAELLKRIAERAAALSRMR